MADKYSDKLKDPRWQKKRLEILQRDDWTCQKCGDNESTLHVHHKRYLGDIDPWDYPEHLLITLCESCHEFEMANMDGICDSLIEQLKEKFLSEDISEIAIGFHFLVLPHIRELTASMLGSLLANPKLMHELITRYQKHLHKKAMEKVKNG